MNKFSSKPLRISKRPAYHETLDEFYGSIDNQTDIPFHVLRMFIRWFERTYKTLLMQADATLVLVANNSGNCEDHIEELHSLLGRAKKSQAFPLWGYAIQRRSSVTSSSYLRHPRPEGYAICSNAEASATLKLGDSYNMLKFPGEGGQTKWSTLSKSGPPKTKKKQKRNRARTNWFTINIPNEPVTVESLYQMAVHLGRLYADIAGTGLEEEIEKEPLALHRQPIGAVWMEQGPALLPGWLADAETSTDKAAKTEELKKKKNTATARMLKWQADEIEARRNRNLWKEKWTHYNKRLKELNAL